MPTAVSDLRLYVIGCGEGESTVFQFDGKFGIIDSFRYKTQVPALALLKKLGASRLEFVGLTHPHEYHYGGLIDVVEYFLSRGGVGEFWRYPALDWRRLYPVLKLRAQRRKVSPMLFKAAQDKLSELEKFFNCLFELKKKVIIRHLEVGQVLHLSEQIQCHAIAPPGQIRQEADERLAAELEHTEHRPEPLNDYCFGLHLQFLQCSAYLTGDVTERSWTACRKDPTWQNLTLSRQNVFYKAAHHGSATSNPDWLLDRVRGAGDNRFGVTRYLPSALPRPSMMTKLHARGATYRLSDHPNASKKILEPECLQIDFSASGIQCTRTPLSVLTS